MRFPAAPALRASCLAALLLAACGPSSGPAGGGSGGAGGGGGAAGAQPSSAVTTAAPPTTTGTARPSPAATGVTLSAVKFTRGTAHLTATGGTVADEDIPLTSGEIDGNAVGLTYGHPSATASTIGVTIGGPVPLITVFVRAFIVNPRRLPGPDPCTVTLTRNEANAIAGTFTCPDVHFFAAELNGGDGAVRGTFEASR